MEKMKKQIFEELKAQMQVNQQFIEEKNTSFTERVKFFKNQIQQN